MQSNREFHTSSRRTQIPNPDPAGTGVTVQQVLSETSSALAGSGIEDPSLNAEILLRHALSCTRTSLYASPGRQLTAQEHSALGDAVTMRLRHVPLQYITHNAAFLNLTLHVDKDVLIPRPETEVLVETVIKKLSVLLIQDQPQVLCDIGTGCGNLAIALAGAFPEARVYATDLSPVALTVARRNAAVHHAGGICFVEGDLCAPLDAFYLNNEVDAIVCNPPYIPTVEIESLPREIREFEPRIALDGGEDGLSVIRRLILESPSYLCSGGLLAMEIGQGQAQSVVCMMKEQDQCADIEVIRDLGGIERVVSAIRA